VQVLRRDQRAVRALLGTWDVQAALLPPRDEAWPFRTWHDGAALDLAIHDVWCRPAPTEPWVVQLMIADTREDRWLFRHVPSIARSLATVGGVTAEGIPFVGPEIQLLYKAWRHRPKDDADFVQTLPALRPASRRWLKEALTKLNSEHPWLDRLDGDLGAIPR
jgi:hypothetical protein